MLTSVVLSLLDVKRNRSYNNEMIATVVNAGAVIVGSLIGLLLHRTLGERFRTTIFSAIGVASLTIGMATALETQRFLYLALALAIGGLIGSRLEIENGILKLGELLKRRFAAKHGGHNFGGGFMNASVLFCVGALSIIGSFRAGVDGDYQLILTKSVLDGFMSIMLAAALGIGVAFSALTVLLYQGSLTVISQWLQPYVTELVLSELSGTGGALIIMIGLNLLRSKQIQTANFLPALVVVLLFVLIDPYINGLFG